MFNDCWNVLNFKTACNVKCTSPMPLPHSPPASGLAVRDSLACETKSNQLRRCCIQIRSGSSVFDLLHLVAFYFFLFLLNKFSHRIDNIVVKSWWGYGYTQRVVKVLQLHGVLYSILPSFDMTIIIVTNSTPVDPLANNKIMLINLVISIMVLLSCVSQKTISWYS